MKNLLIDKNLVFCFIRRSREQLVSNFFVLEYIVDKTVLSSKDNANIAPLYIYPETDKPKELQQKKHPNFSLNFLKNADDFNNFC